MTNANTHQFISDKSVSGQELRTLRNNIALQVSRDDVPVLLMTSATSGRASLMLQLI